MSLPIGTTYCSSSFISVSFWSLVSYFLGGGTVVKHILYSLIIDGYRELKSRTITNESYKPGIGSITKPPWYFSCYCKFSFRSGSIYGKLANVVIKRFSTLLARPIRMIVPSGVYVSFASYAISGIYINCFWTYRAANYSRSNSGISLFLVCYVFFKSDGKSTAGVMIKLSSLDKTLIQ